MKALNVVILAAGKGERMVSGKPKVMHEIMGTPMIGHAVEQARELGPSRIIAILGYGREIVEAYLKDLAVGIAVQTEQKGTAHALLCAEGSIGEGDILVLYGDVPLIEAGTLRSFLSFYEKARAITFMTTTVDDPHGYGRVITRGDTIDEIVEDADATPEQKEIKVINTGICLIPREHFALLRSIRAENRKAEYYLTDICKAAGVQGIAVRAYHHGKASEVLGINTRSELLDANLAMRRRIQDRHMAKGVTLLDRNIYIENTVTIGKDTTIFPDCYLRGATSVGENVSIGPNTLIARSTIRDGAAIEGFVVMEGADIGEGARIGPFSRIRPTTTIGKNVKVGNFVEVKNSILKEDAKAGHLSYIGDSEIGRSVNIGAGTITCNYDGKKKHRTVIEDNVFVGSNTELVAPVRVGRDAVIGAGSTITKDVPEGSLAVSRSPQKHIEGYGRKKRCAE
jgi:bifunctional UDP-N-acetylglucosamine pyrophosphorylase / glucosamine-1-phosphate N-acetyltransferase